MNFEIDKHNDYIANHYADGVSMYSERSCFIYGMPSEVGYVENIRRCLTDINNSHIALGYALIALMFDNDRTKTESEKPVATSQQSKCNDEHEFFRLSPVKIPLSGGNYDYTRYDRFRGLSLRELLLQYLALEKKYNELREMFNIKNDIGVTV